MVSTHTPFLTTRTNGTLTYEAATSSDLRRLFETFKRAPAIALRVTEQKLDEELDGPYGSGALGFAYEYATIPELEPLVE
jgi:hypothetical protein